MCSECGEFASFLSVYFFDIAHTSQVGEPLLGPMNFVVDCIDHVFFDRCTELNITNDLGSLVLVNELGVWDVLCLSPVHSRFAVIVRPVKNG